jgi:hypothetical protein
LHRCRSVSFLDEDARDDPVKSQVVPLAMEA